MVDVPLAHNRDRLETAVRMLGKAGHHVAVVHAPALLAFEILTDLPAAKRRLRAELIVAGGIEIDVMDTEQKRVVCLPALTERVDAEDWIGHEIRLLPLVRVVHGRAHGTTCRPWRRYTAKSSSVVSSNGSSSVSVNRTRQASARLAGTSAYFSMNFRTAARLSPRSNDTTTASRCSRPASARPPSRPSRWNASDRAASQVFHGGGTRPACSIAQRW